MTEKKEKYLIGEFTLDVASRELSIHQESIEIEPKAFDLLIYLIKNRDRAVDKDELLEAVWPGLIITDTALTRAVMKARKALDDDAARQAMIKTIHGHGYRFVADVDMAHSEDVLRESFQDRPSAGASWQRLFIALSVVALLSITWWVIRPEPAQTDELRLAVLPLTELSDDPEFAWTELGLMSYVAQSVLDDGGLAVVSNGNVVGLAERFEWNGDLGDPANQDLLDKLRSVYGASHVLAMTLRPESGAWRMNYALRSPDGNVQQGTMVGDEGTALADGVVQAVYGLLLKRRRSGNDVPLLSPDPFHNEAFARGMSLSLEGRCPEAIRYFEVIVDQEPDLFEPRYHLASCLRIMGEADRTEELLTELIQDLEQEVEPGEASIELARAWLLSGILFNRTGRMDQARDAYSRALVLAEQIGEPDFEARVLHNFSILHEDINDLDRAEELLDQAVVSYQRAGREVMPGQLWSGRANINMARGELDTADVDLKKALEAFREIGDRRNEAMMLNNTGYLRRRQGRIDEAEPYHLRSLEIRQDIGDRVGQGRIWSMLSGVYMAQGRYEEAEQAASEALTVARETRDRLYEGTSLASLADAEKVLGRRQAAQEHYLQARDVFAAIEDHRRTLEVDLRLAQLLLEDGQAAEARSLAEQVLAQARESSVMNAEVQALEKLGDIAYSNDETAHAISLWQEALDVLSQTSWASKINTLTTKLANAFMDQGELERATPLVGKLAVSEPGIASLKAQARYSHLTHDDRYAVELMQHAKDIAGVNWEDASEETLQSYLTAASSR